MSFLNSAIKIWHAATSASTDATLDPKWVRWGGWVLAALLIPAVVTDVRDALTKPFWADEIVTVAVARLGVLSAIWNALLRAADNQPPFFFVVTSLATRLVENESLGYRLPALIGFYCVPFCLYLFVARRVGMLGGLIAALVPILSGFRGYATEARPYGLEVGSLALGLLCWQRLETSRWISVPLGLCLAAAVALHFYAVLVLPAFFLAEAVRMYRTREFRYAGWAALIAAVIPLFLALPLVRSARNYYGAHFWALPSLQSLAFSYSSLTGLSVLTVGVVLFLFAIMLTGMTSLWSGRRLDPGRSFNGVRPEECALAAFLLVLPIVAYLAAMVGQGGFLPRYVLPMVVGLGSATGFVVAGFGRSVTMTVLAVLVVNQVLVSVIHARTVFHARSSSVVENSSVPLLEQMLRDFPSPGPVVISSGTDYLPLAYYSRPEVAERIMMLVDPPTALKAVGTDSVDLELMALKPYLPLNVQEFSVFRAAHQRFLLFSSGTSWDWWPGRLSREGHILTLRQERGSNRLYEVELLQ